MPYLAIGENEDPSRVRICQLSSAASGDIIIEECDDPASEQEPPPRLRQLIFLAQLGTVQTEMRLSSSSSSNTSNKKRRPQQQQKSGSSGKIGDSAQALLPVDHGYLAFELHRIMVAGLSLLAPVLAAAATAAAATAEQALLSSTTSTQADNNNNDDNNNNNGNLRTLVLGLGGGALAMFLRRHFNAHVQVGW